jgi:hypothetical protein
MDGANNIYDADYAENQIRKVTQSTGIINSIGGVWDPYYGRTPYGGDGGPATSAEMTNPYGIATDAAANVYFSDNTQVVRRISPNGIINMVAGSIALGEGYSGDNGPATLAQLKEPLGLAVDASGNLFIADAANNVIRKVTPAGIISTYAGNYALGHGYTGDDGPATAAQLDFPMAVAVDGGGNLYIADNGNGAIRMVTPEGTINTVVAAELCPVGATTCYPLGADSVPHISRPQGAARIHPEKTPAGIPIEPYSVAVTANGNVFFSDLLNNVVSKIDVSAPPTLTFANTAAGSTTPQQDVKIKNLGTQPLTISQIGISSNFVFGSDTTCSLSNQITLDQGQSCVLGIAFEPSTNGIFSGSVVISDDSLGNSADKETITLNGESVLQSQTISFTTITLPQVAGTNLGLSATATSSLTVSFASLTSSVCTVAGTSASLISYGLCTIQATQAGGGLYLPAAPVSQTFAIGHASQAITFPPIPSGQVAATNLNLSATATSGLAVSFASLTPTICTVNGTSASLVSYGFCTIQARQAGNNVYFGAPSVNQTFGIGHASQTITFTPIAAGQVAATSLPLSATATSGLAVTFTSLTPSICTVNGTTASLVAYGFCGIQATQAGNSEYFAAPAVSQTFGVGHASQTINFTPIAGQVAATNVNLSATATSGLAVSFASLTPSICTVNGTTASLISYGFCTIQATQAGNGEYFAAPAANQTFGVGHASQTISFGAIPTQTVGTPLALTATASSGLTVGFASTTPTICSVSSTTANMLATGTCTIQATQPGNSEYFAAPPVNRSFTVN